ncbi:polymorphic toxin-type HINT domain-containing protein [Microbispora sp. H10885]|uniref:polymorphic toxin-type HINT domain-containing protein n=1 Tax=Microbispora sp. H10885 TaxID=2729110 RepID=UPI00160438D1|nr:polymorphic toxin-type HINT domain-containing protein [Microbispora sp. H10885]
MTGETGSRPVTALIHGYGDKHLVRIAIADGTKTGTVTATDGHPFWAPGRHTWVDAKNLKPGTWLRTSAGTLVQITAIKNWTAHHQHAHNLTIADLHTYYVQAGVPVLVHNCGIGPDGLINLEKASQSGAAADEGGLSFAGRALQKHADRPGTGVNWPRPPGAENPAGWNEAGQNMFDGVLTDPNSVAHLGYERIGGTWQDTLDVRLPSGLGARFDFNGNFSGFLDGGQTVVRYEIFQGRRIQVINIDDVSGEHVIEFVDSATESVGAVLAIHSSGEGWPDARVSINPRVESVSAEFMVWHWGWLGN